MADKLGIVVRRLERGYSQAEFAGVRKPERAYTGMIERGEVNVSVRTAFKTSRGLSLGLPAFFHEVEQQP